MYALLEYPEREPGIEQYLDGLERAAGVSGPGVASRAQRLTGSDAAEYWSAVDELSVVCRLRSCGVQAALSDVPDIVVQAGADHLGLELTALARTAEVDRLVAEMLSSLVTNTLVHLDLRRPSWRPTSAERRDVVLRTLAACAAGDLAVDLAPPTRPFVQVTIAAATAPAVGSAFDLGDDYDPIPDLEEAARRKEHQLRPLDAVVVGVNLDRAGGDPVSWAAKRRLTAGFGGRAPGLTLAVAPNVVGVLWFLRASLCLEPMFAGWVPNSAFAPSRPGLLDPVLTCLGAH